MADINDLLGELADLSLSWRKEADEPAPWEASNAFVIRAMADELDDLLERYGAERREP